MKIAVWHNLPSGGGKRALYSHIKVLKERGHYLEAWTTDLSSKDYLPLTDLILEHTLPIKLKWDASISYSNPIIRIQNQISIMQEHCKSCVQEIESQGFDMIFVNSCQFLYMSFISNYANIPSILYLGEPHRRLYEALPENIWQAQFSHFLLKKSKTFFKEFRRNYANRIKVMEEIKSAKKYSEILVNSLYSRESIIRSYGIDASVCYLGINRSMFNSSPVKKEPYVVCIGTISFLKSTHKAIQIISKIPSEIRPVLKWVANGIDKQYFNEIQKLAHDLKVIFVPLINISDDELKMILAKAAVMLYTPHLEPFGLAPLEANACGTFVLAVAEGGVRESISDGKNGTLFNGFNVEEIAESLIKFISDLNYAKKIGQEACRFVEENWNEQKMADNIEQALMRHIKL